MPPSVKCHHLRQSIIETLLNAQATFLIAPKDLGFRVSPSTGKVSTIDLTFSSPEEANSKSIQLGPHMGRDHLPIILILIASQRADWEPPQHGNQMKK